LEGETNPGEGVSNVARASKLSLERKNMRKTIPFAAFLALAVAIVSCSPGVAPVGEIEIQYSARGPLETSHASIPGYELTYPAAMLEGEHPIITWGNGTFAIPIVYQGLLDHFASYGFVVIASTSTMTGSGEEMLDGVDWLVDENSREGSVFFNKIDVDHVGATGHSQGGGGTINAGTDPRVTCTAPIQPTPGSVADLQGPMFLIAGSEDSIVPEPWVAASTYGPALVPTIYGIAQGASHLEPLTDAGMMRGYLTAWFCAELLGHEDARTAFFGDGESCEICNNENWVVMRKNLE
jgi:hypothetical protein